MIAKVGLINTWETVIDIIGVKRHINLEQRFSFWKVERQRVSVSMM